MVQASGWKLTSQHCHDVRWRTGKGGGASRNKPSHGSRFRGFHPEILRLLCGFLHVLPISLWVSSRVLLPPENILVVQLDLNECVKVSVMDWRPSHSGFVLDPDSPWPCAGLSSYSLQASTWSTPNHENWEHSFKNLSCNTIMLIRDNISVPYRPRDLILSSRSYINVLLNHSRASDVISVCRLPLPPIAEVIHHQ